MNDRFEKDRVESAVEDMVDDLMESEEVNEGNPRKKLAEQIDGDGEGPDKIQREMDRDEVEYLLNNRKSMDNEEMEEFLNRDKDFQREDFGSFSNTEEKFILQNYQAKTVDEMAEEIDRSPRAVEMQLRIMGLGDRVDR